MSDGIQLHKRYFKVREAGVELSKFLLDLEEKYELTFGEMFELLAERQATLAKSLVRAERHPKNPGKPGDEA